MANCSGRAAYHGTLRRVRDLPIRIADVLERRRCAWHRTSSICVRPIDKLLARMSEFGDGLPASVVIYALAAICMVLYILR